jgi:hypothetical protein
MSETVILLVDNLYAEAVEAVKFRSDLLAFLSKLILITGNLYWRQSF